MVKWINTGCHEASRRRWRTGSEKLKETCSWYGALACQLACDPLSDWRCSSPAAYGEVWLWNRFCWNLLTACSSALNLCLYICTLVGGWFINFFFFILYDFSQKRRFYISCLSCGSAACWWPLYSEPHSLLWSTFAYFRSISNMRSWYYSSAKVIF